MGIRIHKRLGYGLTDLKVEDYRYVDDRLNPDGYLRNHVDRDESDRWTLDGYLSFLNKKNDEYKKIKKPTIEDRMNYNHIFDEAEIKRHIKEGKRWGPYDSICCEAEFGIPEVLCITPISYSFDQEDSWTRYDNMIDYVESTYLRDVDFPPNEIHTITKSNLYPYDGFWDKRDGRVLHTFYAYEFLRRLAIHNKKDDPNYNMNETVQSVKYMGSISKTLGFDSFEDCRDNLRPYIPGCITTICEYFEIFKDIATIREMTPMLYIYWA